MFYLLPTFHIVYHHVVFPNVKEEIHHYELGVSCN